jgi:hypothetical protein
MEQALGKGHGPAASTRRLLQRVKTAGLDEALLDAHGARLIKQIWRDHAARGCDGAC